MLYLCVLLLFVVALVLFSLLFCFVIVCGRVVFVFFYQVSVLAWFRVCVFNRWHITAQSGAVIPLLLCHSHWSSCVCLHVRVSVFIKLHITAQSDPVILVTYLCHSHWSSQGGSVCLHERVSVLREWVYLLNSSVCSSKLSACFFRYSQTYVYNPWETRVPG